jgi:3-deoxy-D-manno-octulosonate 8-phosphate phosphatase (KDO 8-P phosphatase)
MEHLKEKIDPLKLIIFDVDGVLTDGTIIYALVGNDFKMFNVHDGFGIKLLQKAGFKIAVLSSRRSVTVEKRLKELNVHDNFMGLPNKLKAYEQLKDRYDLRDEEIAYVGDDIPDLVVMKRVGFAIAVQNAVDRVKQVAHYITKKHGGHGAVREVVELILKSRGVYDKLINEILDQWEKLEDDNV